MAINLFNAFFLLVIVVFSSACPQKHTVELGHELDEAAYSSLEPYFIYQPSNASCLQASQAQILAQECKKGMEPFLHYHNKKSTASHQKPKHE